MRPWFFVVAGITLMAGCSEFDIKPAPPVPPADPPDPPPAEPQGSPPDWANCPQGWRGVYYNLQVHNPYVNPRPNEPLAPTSPDQLDFWDDRYFVFEDDSPHLDIGQNWWPVDEGLEGDPAYFAVYWHAWIRVWDYTTFSFLLGSADDSWVYIDGDLKAAKPGIQPFVREQFDIDDLEPGQYTIEIYFAHRATELDGFSFRSLNPSGDVDDGVSICYPDFANAE